ncbi:MAG: carbohydrate kinase, partial [Bacilli bacterium]|nr:carbohydrate kinase [Bacilli bacterium]
VFITLGKKGSMCSFKGKDTFAKSEPIKPIDTTGAGDAFMGAVLYMLDKEKEPNMEEVLSFANKVARECCLHLGAI